jgi:hypothetical protein
MSAAIQDAAAVAEDVSYVAHEPSSKLSPMALVIFTFCLIKHFPYKYLLLKTINQG